MKASQQIRTIGYILGIVSLVIISTNMITFKQVSQKDDEVERLLSECKNDFIEKNKLKDYSTVEMLYKNQCKLLFFDSVKLHENVTIFDISECGKVFDSIQERYNPSKIILVEGNIDNSINRYLSQWSLDCRDVNFDTLCFRQTRQPMKFLDCTAKEFSIAPGTNKLSNTFECKNLKTQGFTFKKMKVNDSITPEFINLDADSVRIDTTFITNASFTFARFPKIVEEEAYKKQLVYGKLLEHFKEVNLGDNYAEADISYKDEFEENVLSSAMNGYGHKKYYSIYWTIALLFLMICLNYTVFPKVHYEVYEMANFPKDEDNAQIRNKGSNAFIYYLVIYTTAIFFSININFDKLRYNNRRALIIFLLTYLSGILCLAFLADFILDSGK
jgi:hypothetical protein